MKILVQPYLLQKCVKSQTETLSKSFITINIILYYYISVKLVNTQINKVTEYIWIIWKNTHTKQHSLSLCYPSLTNQSKTKETKQNRHMLHYLYLYYTKIYCQIVIFLCAFKASQGYSLSVFMYWWKAWQKHSKFQDVSPKQCKQMPQLEVTHLPAEAFVSMSTNNSNSWTQTQSLTSIGKGFLPGNSF